MFTDLTVTRYPNGVTNRAENDIFNSLRMPDPTLYHIVDEDFDYYNAANWTVGGVGTPVAPALVAGDGGFISLATSAADNDSNFISLGTATVLSFALSNRKVFFQARAQVNDAVLSDVALGLQVTVAANNFLTPANGLFFRKDAGSANMFLVSRASGVETVSASLGTISSNSNFRVKFFYNPDDGAVYGSLNDGGAVAIRPAAFAAVNLRLVAGVQAGSAAARTMLLDHLFCARER